MLTGRLAALGSDDDATARRWRAVRHGLTGLGILLAAVYWLQLGSGGLPNDLHAYIRPDLTYANTGPEVIHDAYLYSPAFAQAFAPVAHLPWPDVVLLWRGVTLAFLVAMAGPWTVLVLLLWPVASEVNAGNVNLWIAAAVVAGFRYPATWSFVILTKVTPGLGLLWFVFRREWRHLAIALGATAAVVAASAAVGGITPWLDWVAMLARSAGGRTTFPPFPIPPLPRFLAAAVVLWWGARGNHRWSVPVAATLAVPVLWGISLSMLVGALPLVDWAAARQRARRILPAPATERPSAG